MYLLDDGKELSPESMYVTGIPRRPKHLITPSVLTPVPDVMSTPGNLFAIAMVSSSKKDYMVIGTAIQYIISAGC